ncbi:auxin-responsive protein SAUR64-like [Canna indica]|uniref:Auxin-responsive protein SAUR64-like n=1 Tax=Canna indica TaxID=4628 RepID=A0AAQ3L740_9LILI|nr:auxin-responsive protein SAUR64-like [Canna indica]
MLNPMKLIKMVRKWQQVAALRRRRIMSGSSTDISTVSAAVSDFSCNTQLASKGHVFMYTTDGKRFMVPLKYLTNNIFRELLRMSEEEFGLPADGPIMLPCEAASMDYIISLLRSRVPRDVERAVLASIASSRCTKALVPKGLNQQAMLYGF